MNSPFVMAIWYILLIPLLAHSQVSKSPEKPWFIDSDKLIPPASRGVKYFQSNSRPLYPMRYPQGNLVDLHSHVFQHGLGIVSGGDFDAKALFAPWDSRYANKISEQGLLDSNLGLVVVAIYTHPILSAPLKNGIRKQIQMAHDFVKRNPQWVIAKSAQDAENARRNGKNILVLSLEGADGVLETEADLEEFIDKGGISIVTFAHLIDDHFSGAALMSGYQLLANPGAALNSILSNKKGTCDEYLNIDGLTEDGRQLLNKLIKRKVWIDLAHASDKTKSEMMKELSKAKMPLLFTHTGLRQYTRSERGLSQEDINAIAKHGGVVGLVPGESVIGKTKIPKENCPSHCQEKCSGGIFALSAQFNHLARNIGKENIFIGSDFNGAMDHLAPTHKSCKLNSSLDSQGFSDVTQSLDLWLDMEKTGAQSKANRENGVDNFIKMWRKARP